MPSPDSKAIPQKIISVQAEYRLLREIEKNPDISQRELSHRLEIGLAVTNALIKKIVQRGWIRIQGLKPRKIAYLLTPAGFKEKGKIAYNFVKRTLVYYREAKEVLEKELEAIKKEGFETFAIVGSGDIKEIFSIVAQKIEIRVECIIDMEALKNSSFFQIPVFSGQTFYHSFYKNMAKDARSNNTENFLSKDSLIPDQPNENKESQDLEREAEIYRDHNQLQTILKRVDAIIILDNKFPKLLHNWNSGENSKGVNEAPDMDLRAHYLELEQILKNKVIREIFI